MLLSDAASRVPAPSLRVERFDTVIIGAGQAGLAVGQQLAEHDADFVILTDEARVGDNWRQRWDSLRLFTPAAYSGLPGMPFPAPPGHLADKDEVGDYLERYAQRFDLPVRTSSQVQSLTRSGDRYEMTVNGASVEAASVIVAVGAFRTPNIPDVAARLSTDIQQLHSSEYVNPFTLAPGPVLVVGAGNSGAQIALELSQFRKVWLAGRNTGHLPRRLLGRDLFDWIWPIISFATADTRLGRRVRMRAANGGDALIGIPESEIARAGITRLPRVSAERAGFPVCEGAVVKPSVVVWATGFKADYRWVDLPGFEKDGYPTHRRGAVTGQPGLYFLGLPFQHRMTSHLLGGVGVDARYIANQIAEL